MTDFRLIPIPAQRVVRKRVRGRVEDVTLKRYEVHTVVAGVEMKVGEVYQDMQTFEQKTPGRMYVNKRWESIRWFARVPQDTFHRRRHLETRREAIEVVLEVSKSVAEKLELETIEMAQHPSAKFAEMPEATRNAIYRRVVEARL